MKKTIVFTVLLIGILLAGVLIFKPYASSSQGMAVPAMGTDFKVAPVFGYKGVVVSDPSGTLLNADRPGGAAVPATGKDFKVAPVFGYKGAVVSDPSGTILSVTNP